VNRSVSLKFGALLALSTVLPFCAPIPAAIHSSPTPTLAVSAAQPTATLVSSRTAPARRAEHLIVISIDGLRPDAIEEFGAVTLKRLAREGSYSYNARTITPSLTLPSHTSMITGVEPRIHGITWNENRVDSEGVVHVPTIFSLARAQGLTTAAVFSKGKFEHLLLPGSVDFATLPEGNNHWYAGRTATEVENYLAEGRPDLLFVHFGEPDYAGHTLGWMGFTYGWAVRRADSGVARVLAAADKAFGKGEYTVIVTADHGGHGRTHGTEAETDMTIPWIAWGKGVRVGQELPHGVHTTDTAATVLWLLGVREPDVYAGVPVQSAFENQTTLRGAPVPAR
jgi:predicted AlkP superfamily pyrophosphatase or phosphodiesterase